MTLDLQHLTVLRERVRDRLAELEIGPDTVSSESGLSHSYIRDFLKKGTDPGIGKIAKIAATLQCSVAYLIGETDQLVLSRQTSRSCANRQWDDLPLPVRDTADAIEQLEDIDRASISLLRQFALGDANAGDRLGALEQAAQDIRKHISGKRNHKAA